MRISATALPRRLREAAHPAQGWPTRAAKVKDTLLAVVLAPLVLLGLDGLWQAAATPAVLATQVVAVVALLAVAVALTRPYPLVALVVSILAVTWLDTFALLMMVTAYLAGRRIPDSRPALVLFGMVAAVGAALVVVTAPTEPESWLRVVVAFAFDLMFPWVVGMYRRQRAELATAGWERAERLEREQRIIADQARLRERSRIARDMHDSLGHELSLIALRAGALELAPDGDEHVRRAARELRENATAATERLREIIGVLRDDAEPSPVEPVDESVAALVDRARASGVTVTLVRRGDPAALSRMADRAVYRIVQESLTNATKHAPDAPVTVLVEYGADQALVRVANTAPRGGPAPGPGGGRGLVGLRERVRLVGGVLRAGEHEGGWRVEAWLPAHPGDAAEPDQVPAVEGEEPSRTAHYYRQAQLRTRWGLVALIALPGAGAAVVAGLALSLG